MRDPSFKHDDLFDSFDKLRVGLTVFSVEDRLQYYNDHFQYIFRSLQQMDSILGMSFEEITKILVNNGEVAGSLVLNDPDRWIQRRLRMHRTRTGVYTERLTDGRWVDVKERVLDNGLIIGHWADATDRVRYQLRLESAMECMADGFAAWDQAGRLDMYNDKFAERFAGAAGAPRRGQGYKQVLEELAASDNLVTEEDPRDWLIHWLRSRNRPSRQAFMEYRDERFFIVNEQRTLEGSVVTTLTDVTELKEKERELIYRGQSLRQANAELEMAKEILERQGGELVEMAEDIERSRLDIARQKAEIEAIEARERAILDTMADALIVVTPDGEIECVNPVAERMFCFESGGMDGLNIESVFHLESGGFGAFASETPAPADEPFGYSLSEMIATTKDGRSFPVELSATNASTEKGGFLVITARDITRRKADEEALRQSRDVLELKVQERTEALSKALAEQQRTAMAMLRSKEEAELANRAKSEFLANMSHELRTPLNAIIGFADTIGHQVFGPLDNTKYLEYIENIRESGQHLLELINDILDVSAIESGKIEVNFEPVDVSEMIHEALRLVRPRAETARVELLTDVPSGLPQVPADRRRFKQILVNLLSNAVKFTEERGTVKVAAAHADGQVRLMVSDDGIGMNDDDIDKALTPFGRVGDVLTAEREGTGLGLPLTVNLVNLHGGALDIESSPGQGTTVTVSVPVASGQ